MRLELDGIHDLDIVRERDGGYAVHRNGDTHRFEIDEQEPLSRLDALTEELVHQVDNLDGNTLFEVDNVDGKMEAIFIINKVTNCIRALILRTKV